MSNRLLTNVYDQARAQDPRWRPRKVSAKFPFQSGVDFEREGDQADNLYWLAEQAPKILRTEIGGLTGELKDYLLADVPLTWTSLPIMTISPDKPVAWMYGRFRDPSGDTVLVLCGSIGNYIGYCPGDRDATLGGDWYPSDVNGLEEIIEALSSGRIGDARRAQETVDSWKTEYAMAVLSALPRCHIIGSGFSQVLAQVFWTAEDVVVAERKFRRMILGAPLWVRSSTPQPLSPDGPPVDVPGVPDLISMMEEAYGHPRIEFDDKHLGDRLVGYLLYAYTRMRDL